MAQPKTDVEERNKVLIEDRFAAWAAGTGSPFDLLAPDATWTIPGRSIVARTYTTREALMLEVLEPFNARMQTGLKPAIRQIFAEGDWVIVVFDARGIARDGQEYSNSYAWFLRMSDERVVAVTAFLDSIAFNDLWLRVEPRE